MWGYQSAKWQTKYGSFLLFLSSSYALVYPHYTRCRKDFPGRRKPGGKYSQRRHLYIYSDGIKRKQKGQGSIPSLIQLCDVLLRTTLFPSMAGLVSPLKPVRNLVLLSTCIQCLKHQEGLKGAYIFFISIFHVYWNAKMQGNM